MIARNDPGYGLRDLVFLLSHLPGDPEVVGNRCRQALQNALGFRFVALVSSARAAIGCLLKAAAINGANVLVPAYTCRVVAQSVALAGARPLFADIGPRGYNLDPQDPALDTADLAAAIPALLYGNGSVLPPRLIEDPSILLIEDACMAFGSHRIASRQRPNSAAIYSFNIGKTPCAVGGGAIATNDKDLFDRLLPHLEQGRQTPARRHAASSLARIFLLALVPSQQISHLLYRLKTGPLKALAEDTTLNRIDPASYANRGMDRVQILALMRQVRAAAAMRTRRRQWFALYDQGLRDIRQIQRPAAEPGSWLSHYPIRAEHRDRLARFLLINGVETTAAYDYALPELSPWQGLSPGRTFPRATRAARHVLCLPFYSRLTQARVRRICTLVKAFYDGNH